MYRPSKEANKTKGKTTANVPIQNKDGHNQNQSIAFIDNRPETLFQKNIQLMSMGVRQFQGPSTAKKLASKGLGLFRGLGSMVGGLGRLAGIDLPGTYDNITTAALNNELQAGLNLAKAHPATGSIAGNEPIWVQGLRKDDPNKNYKIGQYRRKWGTTFYNRDGKLPGLSGAGGYNEYYAEPADGTATQWGDNRILRQTNDPTGTYWWATDNHYTSFNYIKDA